MLQPEQVQSLLDNYEDLSPLWFIYRATTTEDVDNRLTNFYTTHETTIHAIVDNRTLAIMLTQPDHIYGDNEDYYTVIESDEEEKLKEEYASQYYEDCVEHEIPEYIRNYVDVDRWIDGFIAYESLLNLRGWSEQDDVIVDDISYIVYTE